LEVEAEFCMFWERLPEKSNSTIGLGFAAAVAVVPCCSEPVGEFKLIRFLYSASDIFFDALVLLAGV